MGPVAQQNDAVVLMLVLGGSVTSSLLRDSMWIKRDTERIVPYEREICTLQTQQQRERERGRETARRAIKGEK